MAPQRPNYPKVSMNKRPLILISNDDGIRAPGILHLWRALKKADFADLVIIAPEYERSGAGASITWDRPLLIRKHPWEDETPAWSVDGNPADCIKMGLKILLDRTPDFIASGINAGSNAGRNVLHSGTIGAVVEGIFRGIPGAAFSCENGDSPNFPLAEQYIPSLVKYLFSNPLSPGTLLNVNFPHAVRDKVKGFRMTRQGKGRWIEDPLLHVETSNGPTYWLGGKPEEMTEEVESDINLLKQGFLTAVPIHVHELTDHEEMAKRKKSFESLFS